MKFLTYFIAIFTCFMAAVLGRVITERQDDPSDFIIGSLCIEAALGGMKYIRHPRECQPGLADRLFI
jgi:hypothetical protein